MYDMFKSRHSTVECTLKTHCPIFHSKAHIIDQCEYNLLNKAVASVKIIEPQDDGNRNQFQDDDRPRSDDHYRSDKSRRDDYRRDDRYDDYIRDDDRRND